MILKKPACPAQCDVCALSCAVLPNRIKFWGQEIERLEQINPSQDEEPHWRALLTSAQNVYNSQFKKLMRSDWIIASALAVMC
ncbi:hypothetical protein [Sphingobium yanoikuyae]|uniref:hypothetical protein n=1 Tax=Sphingobium yanoikuyae TaxID=13690 RepID=UPI002431D920|nr:hypothetical protein [Sphingobium yanoikuyae]